MIKGWIAYVVFVALAGVGLFCLVDMVTYTFFAAAVAVVLVAYLLVKGVKVLERKVADE